MMLIYYQNSAFMFGDCECEEGCSLCEKCEFPDCECECIKKDVSDDGYIEDEW